MARSISILTMWYTGVTVVRDGKKFHQHKSKCQHNQNKKRKRHKVRLKRGRKPADPRIKYGVMAGVGCVIPLACI